MRNGSDMDAHRICDLTVVRLFKCIFNLGPYAVNMLQTPRYLNPALDIGRTVTRKVVNRGDLHLCGRALRSCKGGLKFKFDKNSTNL